MRTGRIHLWARIGSNWQSLRALAARELQRGIAPRRLALTLALGFVLGCIPIIGIPTALCAMVALLFRLNLPAIQAANYAAMPLQVALIVPFVRLGGWLAPFSIRPGIDISLLMREPLAFVRHASAPLLEAAGLMAGQAILAWLLISIPVVLVLTAALTTLLRRVPALTAAD